MNTENIVSIRRLPFARANIVRRKAEKGTCCWCGAEKRRWQYGYWDDQHGPSRIGWQGQFFCSIGCAEAYYGEFPRG